MGGAWWNDYVGLTYADHGRTREGCDCWGLVRLVLAEQFGIGLPSHAERYESGQDKRGIAGSIEGNMTDWQRVPVAEAREGDVVLFLIAGLPLHVGIIIGDARYMLHVMRGINATTEQYTSRRWSSRLEGVYRYAG